MSLGSPRNAYGAIVLAFHLRDVRLVYVAGLEPVACLGERRAIVEFIASAEIVRVDVVIECVSGSKW